MNKKLILWCFLRIKKEVKREPEVQKIEKQEQVVVVKEEKVEQQDQEKRTSSENEKETLKVKA